MRTIKFRVWSEEGRKMFNPEYFEHGTSSGVYVPQSDYSTDYLEIMEYTGMEDVNDIEICEGDIVKIKDAWTNGFGKSDMIGEIVLHKGTICARDADSNHLTIYNHISSCEIIGNIYENPELLDKQT